MAARRRPRREGQQRRPGLRLGETGRAWASWDAWPGGLHPPAQRHVQGLLPLPTSATQTPSTQHRAAGAVGHPAPASLSPAQPPHRSGPRQSAAGACRPPRPRPPCSALGLFVSWLRHWLHLRLSRFIRHRRRKSPREPPPPPRESPRLCRSPPFLPAKRHHVVARCGES